MVRVKGHTYKLLRGRREEPGNEAKPNIRSVCAMSSSLPRDNAECSSNDGFSNCRASALIELGVVVYTVEQGLNKEAEFISECLHAPGYQLKKRMR